MFSIDDERLDGLVGTLDRWFLAFMALIFVSDAAIIWPYSDSFFGWLFQVFFEAILVFPVTAFLAYLVLLVALRGKVDVDRLRWAVLLAAVLIAIYVLVFLIGFARSPRSYETGLFGMVIPLGIAGGAFRFWKHSL